MTRLWVMQRTTVGGTRSASVWPWVIFLALVARTATAESGAVLDYEVRYGPLQIMSMRTTARFDGARYHASSDGRTVGIIALLFPWSASSSAVGVRGDDGWHPLRYRADGEYRGQPREVEIDYADGGLRVHVVPPAEADDRDPVPTQLQSATLDPLTAGLAAVASGCRGTLPVFDGRRRYDLLLSDLGETEVPSARHAIYAGRARHCRAAIQSLTGYWHSSPSEERPTQIDCWIAVPRDGLQAVPVYLELSAPRGSLAIPLTAAAPLPQQAEPVRE